MLFLSDNNQSDVIEAFNSTSRYLDDLLNIDNPYFEQMVGQIYPTELQFMEMFLALLPMVYIFLSLFVLLEYVLMLMTSTTETYF